MAGQRSQVILSRNLKAVRELAVGSSGERTFQKNKEQGQGSRGSTLGLSDTGAQGWLRIPLMFKL